MNFIFDGGRLTTQHHIRVAHDELDTFGFFDREQCAQLLPPRVAPRIEAALAAPGRRAPRSTSATEHHRQSPEPPRQWANMDGQR
ncbi:hypothetical protein [Rugosimonospora africana]|uniref:Uncharacterized protein n=1 Tax=Rugosimonospora africana TaxID=556532 RepID=A0A8J3QQB4_9ACTN|nr:hypothetical protein [Rugosimonospora africana]GIH15510.1 hypothetical protein Raf01_36820 [Rugosimonospora africana]